jgi:hypothetical protein
MNFASAQCTPDPAGESSASGRRGADAIQKIRRRRPVTRDGVKHQTNNETDTSYDGSNQT